MCDEVASDGDVGLAEVDDGQLAVGDDDDELPFVAMGRHRTGERRPHPPVAAVVEAELEIFGRVVSDERPPVIGPTGGKHPLAGCGDSVVAVQLAEPGEVVRRGVDVRRPDPVADLVELRDRRTHPAGLEQPVPQERLGPRSATTDHAAQDSRDDVRGARRVVPHGAGFVDQGQRGRVAGVVAGSLAEQHRDAVRRFAVDVVLDELEAGPHLQQVEQGDPLLAGAAPLGHVGGGVEVEHPVAHQQPDRGVRDRLRHAPRDQRRVGGERCRRARTGLPVGCRTARRRHRRDGSPPSPARCPVRRGARRSHRLDSARSHPDAMTVAGAPAVAKSIRSAMMLG